MIEIKSIAKGSYADKKGIRAGEKLVSVNGNVIRDVLDYRFYSCEKEIILTLDTREVKIKKGEYDDIGLEFETYLMDKQESCRNKCIFCFIDQNPHGMRESIYFKDDDTRLAFFFGNYVTLTNVDNNELDRLVKMHISPINVSVQATDAEVRKMMLGNRFADKILDQMQRLADGGISMNAQIVLCKGVNDGEILNKSLFDLERFVPKLRSISVVPVGLTMFRNGLYPLEVFTEEDCRKIIEQVEKAGDAFAEKYGTRIVFASDEFYIRAGLEIPDTDFYEDYPQIENGVGMIRQLCDEVDDEIDFVKDEVENDRKVCVSVATGKASYETVLKQVEKIKKIWYNINCNVYEIKNEFYGENVTVSGLLTGGDIIAQLKGKKLGDTLLIPRNALRHEGDLFLDGVSVGDMEEALGVKVVATCDGAELVRAILEE